ncbi:hypothetical protein [Spirosoma foliorum]|uniref:Uncharacterized protein n=1 Tax=Spirosoma foliorum TaxID=2710596 RepID=A0A7G5H2R2_9BACT|nr:hypothetical protein [Spirosoma foliorum]QMW05404.1 hypothetical protein H3H32_11175 [Spirosoma foliorum]
MLEISMPIRDDLSNFPSRTYWVILSAILATQAVYFAYKSSNQTEIENIKAEMLKSQSTSIVTQHLINGKEVTNEIPAHIIPDSLILKLHR